MFPDFIRICLYSIIVPLRKFPYCFSLLIATVTLGYHVIRVLVYSARKGPPYLESSFTLFEVSAIRLN